MIERVAETDDQRVGHAEMWICDPATGQVFLKLESVAQ